MACDVTNIPGGRRYVRSVGSIADHVLRICDSFISGCNERFVVIMAIKIKVSYEKLDDLRWLVDKLGPAVKSWRMAKNQEGQYKKAYIVLKERQQTLVR